MEGVAAERSVGRRVAGSMAAGMVVMLTATTVVPLPAEARWQRRAIEDDGSEWLLIGGVAATVVVGGALVLWLVLRDDDEGYALAPEVADLLAAAPAVQPLVRTSDEGGLPTAVGVQVEVLRW